MQRCLRLDLSRPALTQCYATNRPWSFEQLYTALDAAWLQNQRQNSAQTKFFQAPDGIL